MYYENATREEGVLSDEEQKKLLDIETSLEVETGYYLFWVRESDQPTSAPSVFAKSPSKLVIYDPRTRTILFQRLLKENNTLLLTHQFKDDDKTEYKMVGIAWEKNTSKFILNGKIVAEVKTQEDIASPTKDYNLNLPGFSYHMFVVLKASPEKRKKFLFDMGESLEKNRISIYFDEINNSNGKRESLISCPGRDEYE